MPNREDYKHVMAWLVFAVLVVVSVVWVAFFSSWATKPAEIFSPDNVQREYSWFYSTRRSLQAKQASIASFNTQIQTISEAQRAVYGGEQSKWELSARDKIAQLNQQVLSLETSYNSECGEYQARWDNAFHSIVAPGDIPRTCSP